MRNTITVCDAREGLASLPEQSVNCIVTSPPYYALRDYGVEGQLGLEPTPAEYVANMVAVFREAKRALRDDGVCFVNLGSSYASTRIESDEMVLRDDLTVEEIQYVLAEIANHVK